MRRYAVTDVEGHVLWEAEYSGPPPAAVVRALEQKGRRLVPLPDRAAARAVITAPAAARLVDGKVCCSHGPGAPDATKRLRRPTP